MGSVVSGRCVSVMFFTLVALNLATASHASNDVTVSIATHYWKQSYAGDFKINTFDIRPVDVESDLAMHSEKNPFFIFQLRHKNPYFPQLKIQKTLINSTKNTVIKPDEFFSIGGLSNFFGELRSIRSEMNFDHLDIDLFYPVWSSESTESELNMGIALRKFDGFTFVTTTDNDLSKCFATYNPSSGAGCPVAYRLDFDDKVPLFYLSSTLDLNVTNTSVNTSLYYGNYKSNEMTDIDINVSYRFAFNLSLAMGYRHAILDLGDFSGLVADITTSGLYSGLSFELSF